MKKERFNNSEDPAQNSARWLTTFNDLVTLLMVFFVLLFTMGTINVKKMTDFQFALQSGLGILEPGNRVSVAVKDSRPIKDMSHVGTQPEGELVRKKGQTMGQSIEKVLQSFETDLGVKVTHTTQATHLTFEDFILFDFGKADINPEGFPFLDKLITLLNKIPYPVRVEGHTDNVPIKTRRFPSNWELSIARAVNVVKYFAAAGRIDPHRLSAVGYGESRPIGPNDTAANRARNRRVEIVLVTEGKRENDK